MRYPISIIYKPNPKKGFQSPFNQKQLFYGLHGPPAPCAGAVAGGRHEAPATGAEDGLGVEREGSGGECADIGERSGGRRGGFGRRNNVAGGGGDGGFLFVFVQNSTRSILNAFPRTFE